MCGFESLLTLIFLTSLSSSLFGLLYSLLILLTLLLYHYLLLKTLSTVLINLFFNLQVFLFIKLVLNLLPCLNHLILKRNLSVNKFRVILFQQEFMAFQKAYTALHILTVSTARKS